MNRLNKIELAFADKACFTMRNHFRCRPASPDNNRSAAGKSLNHNQTERFRPVYRIEKCFGVFQQFHLPLVINFTDELNKRMVKQRADFLLKICLIGWINLRGNFQRYITLYGKLDGLIRLFFFRKTAQIEEIILRMLIEFKAGWGIAMIDGFCPVDIFDRTALGITD